MPAIYRSMKIDNGKPLIAPSAKGLGVRLPPDRDADIPVQADGAVSPLTGGMSVAPSWRALVFYRIPRRLTALVPGASGKPELHCWRLGEGPFQDGAVADRLVLRVSDLKHGFVEPDQSMPVDDYVAALAATQAMWVIDES